MHKNSYFSHYDFWEQTNPDYYNGFGFPVHSNIYDIFKDVFWHCLTSYVIY